MFIGDIVSLADVSVEVIQFERLALARLDSFVLAHPHSDMSPVLPVQEFVRFLFAGASPSPAFGLGIRKADSR